MIKLKSRIISLINSFRLNFPKKISIINYWFLLLFIFWLPLNDDFLPLIMAFWLLTWLLGGNFKLRLSNFDTKPLYIALCIFFFLTIISLIYSNNVNNAFFNIQEKLSMVFFPIIISGSNLRDEKKIKSIFLAFILGNLIAAIYCLCYAFFTNLIIENSHIYIKYWALEGFKNKSFWYLFNQRFNLFSYEYLSIFKHPSYYSMYIVFSMCIIYYFIREKIIVKMKNKIALITLILFFVFMLFMLQSRAGLISLILISITIPSIEVIKNLKKSLIFILISAILVCAVILISSNTVKNNISRLKEISKNNNDSSLIKSDIRLQVWYTSAITIKENFWFGTSPADLTDKLVKNYKKFGLKNAADLRLNSHNQYLETFAGLGVFGFLSLMSIMISAFIISIKNRNYLLLYLMMILSINFLFESVLNRMAGILFMMFFLSLLVYAKTPITGQKNKQTLKEVQ
jgi:O-antigen ligase